MAVIRQRRVRRKVARSFRLKPELVEKIGKIAKEMGESKTYVLESLLEYAIEKHEEEKRTNKK